LDLPGDARLVTHAFPLVDSIVTRRGHWNEVGARVLPAKIGSASRGAAGVRFSANEVCAIVAKPNFAVHASEGSAFFNECARSIRRESEKPARLWNKDGGYGPHMIVVANTCTKRLNILSGFDKLRYFACQSRRAVSGEQASVWPATYLRHPWSSRFGFMQ